jgi:hypothetical protein
MQIAAWAVPKKDPEVAHLRRRSSENQPGLDFGMTRNPKPEIATFPAATPTHLRGKTSRPTDNTARLPVTG